MMPIEKENLWGLADPKGLDVGALEMGLGDMDEGAVPYGNDRFILQRILSASKQSSLPLVGCSSAAAASASPMKRTAGCFLSATALAGALQLPSSRKPH